MVALLALVACGPVPDGFVSDGVPDGPVPDGPLAAGDWAQGSDGYGIVLTVAEDASAHLDNGCWGGDMPVIEVVDGTVDVTFEYVLRAHALGYSEAATLAGTVDGDTFTATLSMDDYPDQDLVLVHGHDIKLYECP